MVSTRFHIAAVLVMCHVFCEAANQQCVNGYSIFGMKLRRHIFKKIRSALGTECVQTCEQDVRCQSFNYVISQNTCELSNRTKEARPEDVLPDSDRYYYQRTRKRVPLGSIPELPGKSCKEIKASENERAVNGNYWLDLKPGTVIPVYCDMETQDIDQPKAVSCQLKLIACTPLAVGVSDSSKIADDKMSSSLVYLKYYPYKGRLYGSRGWCAATKTNTNDFLQVDMGTVQVIHAVATQGKPTGSFTKCYRLSLSVDGVNWNAYEEENMEKIFQGNEDLETVVQNFLADLVQARYIRFYPVTYELWPCMRVEVFVF